MATLKKQARDLGKVIRSCTGLALPDAMKAAKFIVRHRQYDLPGNICTAVPFTCGFECCGTSHYEIRGPKGEYRV